MIMSTVMYFIVFLMLAFPGEARPASIPTPSADNEPLNLFEGDITLSPEDIIFLNEGQYRRKESGASPAHNGQNNAQRDRRVLWVTRIVPYELPESMKAEYEPTIDAAIKEYHEKTCLKFVKHTTEKNWIRFVKKPGCWSRVGKQPYRVGYQEVSLGHGCNHAGTAMHELMHAVGFWHEQSRPDRDDYIKIFWENIPRDKQHNFNKYNHGSVDTLGVLYDYRSLMHYGNKDFTLNGQDTIRSIKNPGQALGQRYELSALDVVKLNALYDCKTSVSNVWSSWSGFSPCNSRCDKYRQRFCSSVNRVKDCPTADQHGIETETMKCPDKECYAPVDGHWGRWSDWGACSTSCGPGLRQRVRTCSDPPPMHGGDDCSGIKNQTKYCKMKKCGLGPDDCDFDFEAGWCVWKLVKPGGPWYLQTGSTSSSDTGPDDDHSGDGGRYIYFESSSPLQSGEHGKVESKMFPPTQETCLTFYYYMYGKEMGTLSVFIQTSNSHKRSIWRKTGDQGQEWHRADISFVSDLDYKVVFDAIKGSGYHSDIALDDICFKNEKCSSSVTTAKPTTMTTQPSTTEYATTALTTEEATTTAGARTTPTTPYYPADRFLIYNAAHDKCISVEAHITASSCNLASPNKMWRWTPYGQLQNIFTLGCLTAPDSPKDWVRVKFAACNRLNTNQIWSCTGDLLRLNNTILNLNFGNVQGGDHVVLFKGTGSWSRWKVFGEDENVCEKRKALTTLQPPSTTALPPSTSKPTPMPTDASTTNPVTTPLTTSQPPSTTALPPSTSKPTPLPTDASTTNPVTTLVTTLQPPSTTALPPSTSKPTPMPTDASTTNLVTTLRPSDSFLIYNADHDKCISMEGSIITASSCDVPSPNKMWQWTPYGQLQNSFTLGCLAAPDSPQDWVQVKLAACDHLNTNQIWSCAGDLLRLNNTILNLNFGNVQGGDHVVLFKGTGAWSRWKVFGEDENVCEKRKEIHSKTQPPTSITSSKATTANPIVPWFQIYSPVHDKCIAAVKHYVIATDCDVSNATQGWAWGNKGQLRNKNTGQCLDVVGEPSDWRRLRVSPCDLLDANQQWSCKGDLVQVGDTNLNLNYGNIIGSIDVFLFRGTGTYSQWKMNHTAQNICATTA